MTNSWIAADWPAPGGVIAGTTLKGSDLQGVGLHGQPGWLNQVHGSNVVTANSSATPPDADGSVSVDPTHICVVRTADCLPVLFAASDGSSVAAAHAGWRGLASGVIENTLKKINAESNSQEPNSILVWLGPAISQASFEVGGEVREIFVAHDDAAATCFTENERGRWQGDLYALARQRLSAAGVTAVFGGGFCTFLDAERFHSYRRDPDCGRMVSFVALSSP